MEADPDTQHYLWTILLTAGRVNEINNLTWDDVNFSGRSVTLWTRKRKGGNREPREIPMIPMLHDLLKNRLQYRNIELPYVFWHSYWSRKIGGRVQGPYNDRKKIMRSLCKKAKVRYFRFHPLRHLTASMLDDLGVPIGVIQRILGHSNRRTTEIYLHSVGAAERDAMNKLEDDIVLSSQSTSIMNFPNNMHTSFWQRKVERPSQEVLKFDVTLLGYIGTGKKYGVSDNAIRKWLKFYENNPVQSAGRLK
jgi:integrase